MQKRWFFLKIFFPIQIVKNGSRNQKLFTQLWYQVWLQEGYAENGDKIIKKYAQYDPFAVDFIVKFLGIFPAATMRIIRNNKEMGIPVLNDFVLDKDKKIEGKVIEVTLFTVHPRFRGNYNLPLYILMRTLYQYCCQEKVDSILIGADKRLYFLLTRFVHFPFQQIGQSQIYEGSLTIPACMNTMELEKVLPRKNPSLYKFIQ